MKIKEAFIINQGHQITDEEIYRAIPNRGKIPILTANNEVKGIWDKAIIDNESLPCITYPTKANMGTCFIQNKIFDANNTAVLTFREKQWKNEIDLEWIAFKLSKIFVNVSTSKEGVNYLNKEIVEELEIQLPKKTKQIEQYKFISELLDVKTKVIHNLAKINRLKELNITIEYNNYQAKNFPVNKVFDYIGGNSGLTEEEIYQKIMVNEKKYDVLSSSTKERTKLGKIAKCYIKGRELKVFENQEGILVARNGEAGTIAYLDKGEYTINDHAYILKLKEGFEYDISLKWVCIQYPKLFLEFSSSSDNGTWNMTGFFEHAKFDIPDRKAQDAIVAKFEILYVYERTLTAILKRLDNVLDKDIIN